MLDKSEGNPGWKIDNGVANDMDSMLVSLKSEDNLQCNAEATRHSKLIQLCLRVP